MNRTHHSIIRQPLGLRRSAKSVLASVLAGAVLAMSAHADMFQPRVTPGGIAPQPWITSFTQKGTNTTLNWYGLEGSYNILLTPSLAPASWTNVATVLASTYANGLTAYTLRADLDDKPRLALAVMELDGVTMLGTLVSAVPETLLPSILGSLKGTGASVPGAVSLAESLDGQLSFRLPAGVRPRALTPRERKQGFVVAFAGWDSELLVMKLADDATPVKDQPDIVKSTVLSYQGVDPKTLKPIQYLLTSAGPDFIYSSAKVSEAAGEGLFVAGYMPWAYWGYSILAKGPKALDLIVGLFTALSLGPSAVPKLVAASPRLPVARRVSLLTPGMSTLILALLAAAVVWFWWRNRGN